MYINFSTKKGHEYAIATKSVRSGSKVNKTDTIYLGRVIDKEKNIFKSRERGLFVFDPETGTFSNVPPEYQEPVIERKNKNRSRPVLSVSFGAVFLLDSYLKSIDFYSVLDGIRYRNSDTLRALLFFYILSDMSNCYAQTWWNLSYAKFLFPKAQLSSQRISEALEDIGSEEARRGFFEKYVPFLENMHCATIKHGIKDGILIDSTGLPNAIKLPITAVSNHNGVISEEIRLIYVVKQDTGFPLFYRYIPGNVVDVSTLARTIAELEENNITAKFVILDAGYYTGKNADELYDKGISFLCRMKGNYKLYRQILADHLATLDSKENFVTHHKRRYYVKHIPCYIGSTDNLPAHAYLCRDVNTNDDLGRHLCEKAYDQKISDEDLYDEMVTKGVFVLVSSDEIDKKDLLPLYYTRDQVEKSFNVSKQLGKLLPLNVEKEETFRGHILLSFMASVIISMMKKQIKIASEKSNKRQKNLTFEEMLFVLIHHHALVYEDKLLINEAVAKANRAYEIFGVDVPVTIPFEDS